MKATINNIFKTISAICIFAAAGSAIVGFVNHGDTRHAVSEVSFATITFENVSLSRSYDIIVDGEIIGKVNPRRGIEHRIISGSHTIVYRNADTGENASQEQAVIIIEHEHLTVYCSYAG